MNQYFTSIFFWIWHMIKNDDEFNSKNVNLFQNKKNIKCKFKKNYIEQNTSTYKNKFAWIKIINMNFTQIKKFKRKIINWFVHHFEQKFDDMKSTTNINKIISLMKKLRANYKIYFDERSFNHIENFLQWIITNCFYNDWRTKSRRQKRK